MITKSKKRSDSRVYGLITGLIVPLITMIFFYLFRNPENFDAFWQQMVSINLLSRMVSLCVVPNLLVFFIFIWTNKLNSAYGVIGATFVYTFIVLILITLV